MGRIPPHARISSASRRRLAEWLVGTSLRDIERDLVLETLSHTHGNRTAGGAAAWRIGADTAEQNCRVFCKGFSRPSP